MSYHLISDPIGMILARKPRIHFICPVNNERLYQDTLLRSLQMNRYASLTKVVGATSAAQAFNENIGNHPPGDISVLIHQDVFLPPYWTDRMEAIFDNTRFGVAGCVGASFQGFFANVYASPTEYINYNQHKLPAPVDSLDELLLVFPSDTPIRLDPDLGWHLYGADACIKARKLGLDALAIDNCVVHMCTRVNYDAKQDETFVKSLTVFLAKNPGPIKTTIITVHGNGNVTSP